VILICEDRVDIRSCQGRNEAEKRRSREAYDVGRRRRYGQAKDEAQPARVPVPKRALPDEGDEEDDDERGEQADEEELDASDALVLGEGVLD